MDVREIKKDRLRYSKNSLSSSLIYLAIIANVFYFASVYRTDVGTYYYTWLTGASIIYNLLFMLTSFLCSEGVKKYHFGYSITIAVLGVLQICRIFIIPKKAHEAMITLADKSEVAVMGDAQFTRIFIYLCISGALCIVAGIIGAIKSATLRNYEKELEARSNQ